MIEAGKCPMRGCEGEHPCCAFAAGSLACVNGACRNPHHREVKR